MDGALSGTIARFSVRIAFMPPKEASTFELKNGTVDALHLVIKTGEVDVLREELIARYGAMPDFFAGDAVAIDLRRLPAESQVPLSELTELLRGLQLSTIGVVALEAQHEWVGASGLTLFPDRDRRSPLPVEPEPAAAPLIADPAMPRAAAAATIVEKPLRSGQRIYADGDLVVLGVVSHGAEIIAGGNIHVYAPLRGRALAGVRGDRDARIFCTCMEPELISIAGIYRTVETALPDDVQGKAAQVRLLGERLLVEALELR
jgi:septum site-determining protein MinC